MNAVFHYLNLRRCLLILFLLVSARSGAAGLHIAGGELTYRYIGSNQYQLDLDLYTHCLSKPDKIFFNISSPDASFTAYSVEAGTLTDLGEVTLLCNGVQPQSKCHTTDSTVFAIRHWRASATVTLSNQSVCEYIFSYKGGERSFWSTNGGAGEAYYTEAYLRNCSNMNISSPAFGEKPRFLAAEGVCQLKKMPVTDRNAASGNSGLKFALTAPLTDDGLPITYNSTFSPSTPVSHYTVDDPYKYDSGICAGFRIDSITGTLFFKASKKETGSIGITVTNTVDGVVVSRVMRDYLLSVIYSQNENRKPQVIAEENKTVFTVKVGSTLNIKIRSFDQAPNDSVALYAYNLPDWSTFKIGDPNKKWQTADLTWTPTISQVRKEPYIIYVQAQDDVDGCEDLIYQGVTTKIIYITVEDTIPHPEKSGLHIAGGELTYRYVGSNQYQLTLDLYTHCLSEPDSIMFNVGSPDASFTPYSVKATALKDLGNVTLLCNGENAQGNCESRDTTLFSIRHWRASATVMLSNQSVCEYIFSYKGGKRSFWSTNGGAGETYYTEAYLRNCRDMNISSPQFNAKPRFMASKDDCQIKDLPVTDRNNAAGRSALRFSLMAPQKGAGVPISYSNSFTAAHPVSYVKHSDATQIDTFTCTGFRLDSLTGTLFFKSVKIETGPVGIQVTNTINDTVVSRVSRDFLLHIIENRAMNTMPIVRTYDGLSEYTIKAGTTFTLKCVTFDGNPDDSLQLFAYNLPEGSTFSVTDTLRKWPQGIFKWTPKKNQSRNAPYIIHLKAEDNVPGCADFIYHGKSTWFVYVYVESNGPDTIMSVGRTPEHNFKIYPNPSSGQIWVEGLTQQPQWIRLNDVSGRQYNIPSVWTDGKLRVDLSGMQPGMYILEAGDPSGAYRMVLYRLRE